MAFTCDDMGEVGHISAERFFEREITSFLINGATKRSECTS